MQHNGNQPRGVPIIGAKKLMPIESIALEGLGWFHPTPEITGEHVAHLLIIVTTLILPKPEHYMFDIKAYADEHDLTRFFTMEPPESIKKLQKENANLKDLKDQLKALDATKTEEANAKGDEPQHN